MWIINSLQFTETNFFKVEVCDFEVTEIIIYITFISNTIQFYSFFR